MIGSQEMTSGLDPIPSAQSWSFFSRISGEHSSGIAPEHSPVQQAKVFASGLRGSSGGRHPCAPTSITTAALAPTTKDVRHSGKGSVVTAGMVAVPSGVTERKGRTPGREFEHQAATLAFRTGGQRKILWPFCKG